MQWLTFTSAVAATVLLLAVIGLPLARIIGLRGYAMIAASPAFAVTIVAITAVAAPWIGLSWSVLPVILVAVVVGLVLFLIRRATRRATPPPAPRRRFDGWLLFAFLVAAALLAYRVVAVFGSPENISQTFDNIFHLNGVRFVLDTGNASSLWLGRMTNPSGGLGFYPAAWHGLVALIVQLSGASIPAAINAATLVISAVVWPLGALLLTRTLFGRSPVLSVSAGLLAASLPVFPILLMDYGVLYPYQLGLALLPVALAATLRALGLAGGVATAPGRVWWAVAVLGCLPGLALAHPGSLVGWLALTAPMVAVFGVLRLRGARTVGRRWLIVGAFVAYLAVGAVLLDTLRPPAEARGWPPQMGILDAVIDVVTISAWYEVSAVIAAAAVLAGVVWAFIARSARGYVALGMYAVTALLYVAVAALPLLALRDALTGGWYNNLPRLAAVLPIVLVPLGAYGAACTWSWLARRSAVHRVTARRPRWIAATLAVVATALVALGMQAPLLSPIPTAERWAQSPFVLGPASALLTSDEAALLSRLDEHVPEGVVVAGSPWTGASLAYALADRPVLMPHTLMEIGDELETINDGLADASAGDEVCDALEDLGVGFVLDFAGREVHPGEHPLPGLQGLADSDAVRLVDEQGDARLYEIVACAP
ncbi:hypothetical protein SAMN04487846_1230 [Microbacterium sp. cf046]|uniref:DUF6541 family protein n=1 Tax=Microbacterium sp. cf046 TaxID=1761803 RepID=UPI0008EAE61A|nr:DUF6541 family protein [Microbacterium sp. cf046]SFR95750.1 hypothetical protein SAMN04487846_1230 [Microbacterium sp. cf046]